jgi:hypothetical protein
VSTIAHRGFVHLRKDVSKNSIAVAVLSSDRDAAEVDKIFHDTDSICRLIKRIGRPNGIWACYGAGPTGYDLQRLLASMGVRCDVEGSITRAGNAHLRGQLCKAAWAYQQPQRRCRHQRASTGRANRDRGSLVGRASPAVQAIPTTGHPQEPSLRRGCRHRP